MAHSDSRELGTLVGLSHRRREENALGQGERWGASSLPVEQWETELKLRWMELTCDKSCVGTYEDVCFHPDEMLVLFCFETNVNVFKTKFQWLWLCFTAGTMVMMKLSALLIAYFLVICQMYSSHAAPTR